MFREDGVTERRSSGCCIVVAAVVASLLNKGYCSRAEACSWCTCDNACSGRSACDDIAYLELRSPGASAYGNWVPTNSCLLG